MVSAIDCAELILLCFLLIFGFFVFSFHYSNQHYSTNQTLKKKKKITFLFLFSSHYIRYNNNNNNTIASILKSSILSLSHTHKKYRDDSESTAKLAGMDFTSPSSQTRPSFHFQFQEVIKSSYIYTCVYICLKILFHISFFGCFSFYG